MVMFSSVRYKWTMLKQSSVCTLNPKNSYPKPSVHTHIGEVLMLGGHPLVMEEER